MGSHSGLDFAFHGLLMRVSISSMFIGHMSVFDEMLFMYLPIFLLYCLFFIFI